MQGRKKSPQKRRISRGREMVLQDDYESMVALVQASDWGTTPGIGANYAADEKFSNVTLEI
jgi:hypothetical protein